MGAPFSFFAKERKRPSGSKRKKTEWKENGYEQIVKRSWAFGATVARLHGMQEAEGSNPSTSNIYNEYIGPFEARLMDYLDTMQVCLNGHQINDSHNRNPSSNREFCKECGAKTITSCSKCKAEIKGHKYSDTIGAVYVMDVPKYCHACGVPYPWVEKMAKPPETAPDDYSKLKKIFAKFHAVAIQLRIRRDERTPLTISDEYDVQYLLRALLTVDFEDIRPEEWTPSYADSSSRMDFLLKDEKIVVETKKTRKSMTAKELGDQIIIDVARYSKHPDCKTLYCFVYDPDYHLPNPNSVEKDLTKQSEGLNVVVLIYLRR